MKYLISFLLLTTPICSDNCKEIIASIEQLKDEVVKSQEWVERSPWIDQEEIIFLEGELKGLNEALWIIEKYCPSNS